VRGTIWQLKGITITPSVTQFYQGPTAGNADHVFDYGGKAEAFLNIDFAKLGLWNGFAMQGRTSRLRSAR
jgi:hypothetical protein